MSLFRFAYSNLRRKPTDAMFFAFSIFAASLVITLFFAIIANPYYGMESNGEGILFGGNEMIASFDQGIGTGLFTMMLSLFMIFVCILMVFLSNKFFLMSKTKDIGIMMISGSSIFKIIKFLVVQNFLIILAAAPLGTIAGCILFPIVNVMIYSIMAIQAPVFVFSGSAMGYCLATLIITAVFLVLSDAGFVYRMDTLSELIQTRKSMDPVGKQKNIFLKAVYVAVYLLSIYLPFSITHRSMNAVFLIYQSLAIVLGAGNVFRYVLPDIISKLKEHLFSADRHLMISCGNLRYSVINGNLLVTVILLSTSSLFLYLCKFYEDKATMMVVMIAFIVTMIMICICMLYKLAADGLSKKQVFLNMIAIGYLKQDIRKIMRQEIIGFFGSVILLSMPLLVVVTTLFANAKDIPWSFAMGLLMAFIGFLTAAALLMYVIYCRIIFQNYQDETLCGGSEDE